MKQQFVISPEEYHQLSLLRDILIHLRDETDEMKEENLDSFINGVSHPERLLSDLGLRIQSMNTLLSDGEQVLGRILTGTYDPSERTLDGFSLSK